jgi:hypothetical protein
MLREEKRNEIRELITMMKKLDNTGRALLVHDASLLVARQEMEQFAKQPA